MYPQNRVAANLLMKLSLAVLYNVFFNKRKNIKKFKNASLVIFSVQIGEIRIFLQFLIICL